MYFCIIAELVGNILVAYKRVKRRRELRDIGILKKSGKKKIY
jgi:hypothetical protein